MSKWENDAAVQNFREYLRIKSVQPNVNYDECVVFLRKQAAQLGLPIRVVELTAKKPIVVLTWEGTQPNLPSILLNSHMDVVPVFEESWTHKPFEAEIDDGKIYARGSQDMKCVGIQYLEAIRKLKANGIRLKRTLHLSFVPDEEIGGVEGMKKWVVNPDFKNLNVGFALDEGMANPDNDYILFYGERSIWQIRVTCKGPPGHGSLLFPNTAGEKLRIVIDKFMNYREEQKRILDNNPNKTIGDVTSVNLTMISGGVQENVIPEALSATFDIRIAVDVNHDDFLKMIEGWLRDARAGDEKFDITYEFIQHNPFVPSTKIDNTNPYWVAFKAAADELKLKLLCRIFPGGTDSRYVRQKEIPALGFSPMNNTPVLLHDHEEFLRVDVFLKGIDTYVKLITAVANVS